MISPEYQQDAASLTNNSKVSEHTNSQENDNGDEENPEPVFDDALAYSSEQPSGWTTAEKYEDMDPMIWETNPW